MGILDSLLKKKSISVDPNYMEFATDSEAHEWAEENGYEITKIQYSSSSRSCMCWMREVTD